jgi:hypothetical protein
MRRRFLPGSRLSSGEAEIPLEAEAELGRGGDSSRGRGCARARQRFFPRPRLSSGEAEILPEAEAGVTTVVSLARVVGTVVGMGE